jgi:NADH-quinone oxidoreductase subunit H
MILTTLIIIICVVAVMLLSVAYMILAERKIAGWIQDRIGPNRAGPRGIIQPICDGLKLLFKEDYTPGNVSRLLFIIAPAITMGLAVAAFAVIPFGGEIQIGDRLIPLQIASVDIGILFILAAGSLGVYGVLLGGWASNNKYSFFGGLRVAVQMLSYETPMALAILSIIMLSGSIQLEKIVQLQIDGGPAFLGWNVFSQPLVFLIFLVCIFAETKRVPFDLTECEQELVGGYHTEYASMKFGLYFLGEYAHMIVASSLALVLFFGGWHVPFITSNEPSIGATILRCVCFYVKLWIFIYFYMWVRWTLPRFRIDQVMRIGWKAGVLGGLMLLMLNALILYLFPNDGWASRFVQLAANVALFIVAVLAVGYSKTELSVENQPVSLERIDEVTQ